MKEITINGYGAAIRKAAELESLGYKTAIIRGTPCIVRYWR
jgi:hypothetical protein